MFGLGVGSTVSSTAGSWQSGAYYSATGATSVVGTSGATFYITGVQLEAGTSATDFEFLPYDVSLERCLRYYEKSYSYGTAVGTATTDGMRHGGHNSSGTTGYLNHSLLFVCHKRTNPTMTIYDTSGNSGKCVRGTFGSGETTNSNVATDSGSEKSVHVYSNTGNSHSVIYYQFQAVAEL